MFSLNASERALYFRLLRHRVPRATSVISMPAKGLRTFDHRRGDHPGPHAVVFTPAGGLSASDSRLLPRTVLQGRLYASEEALFLRPSTGLGRVTVILTPAEGLGTSDVGHIPDPARRWLISTPAGGLRPRHQELNAYEWAWYFRRMGQSVDLCPRRGFVPSTGVRGSPRRGGQVSMPADGLGTSDYPS